MVLAPEHPLVAKITTSVQHEAVNEYIALRQGPDLNEIACLIRKKVTGCFTGGHAINPFNDAKIPIWIADYVLLDYGTGAIMAVPAGDDRDFAFAKHFDLPVVEIIDQTENPTAGREEKVGRMINSDFLNGMDVKSAVAEMIKRIGDLGIGEGKVNYKLRDANFSRQRYWGEPFPVEYTPEGRTEVYELDQLPLTLPADVKDYKPAADGRSPLAKVDSWVNKANGKYCRN